MKAATLLRLATASAWNRRSTLVSTLAAIALAVTMLLGVERARTAVRDGFTQAVSGTDLIVGARTSPVQLVLYAVFRLGDATSNLRWESYQRIATHPLVAWSIPLSLGDSHRGFPVLGTGAAYFEHFRHGDGRRLSLASGAPFDALFDVVIGAEVASRLGYAVGDAVVLSHGSGAVTLPEHGDKPFRVSGVLARTGTPVDRTLHVGLEAIEAIHLDWQGGAPLPGVKIAPEFVRKFDLSPKAITAALVGLKARAGVFQMQRFVDGYEPEALVAVLPGLALDQLWRIMDGFERALLAISGLVVVIGLAGMMAVVLASLGERRRELAILRSVGAGPTDVALLLGLEGLLLTILGCVAGYALLAALTLATAPLIQARFGLTLPAWGAIAAEATLLGAVLFAGIIASLIPAWRAARLALADGLTPRL